MTVTAPPSTCKGCNFPLGSDAHLALCKHAYGPGYLGVTSVTGLLDIGGKSVRMAGAAAKLTREGLSYRQVWKEKRDAGTRVHGYIESWIAGRDVECPEDDMGYLDGVEAFIADHSPEWFETERVVLGSVWIGGHPQINYGGRFDAIARVGDAVWLLDWKTGRQYHVEHSIQLAAYRHADGMANWDATGALLPTLDALPPIARCACVYFSADGTYELVEYPAGRESWHLFSLLAEAKVRHEELAQMCERGEM